MLFTVKITDNVVYSKELLLMLLTVKVTVNFVYSKGGC